MDYDEESDTRCLMNHWPCGAALPEDYLHGDVGAAFWPDTPAGYRRFRVFHLDTDASIPVVSAWTIGGG